MNNTVTLPRELAEMIERTWRARLPLGQDNVVHGLIQLRLILAQQAELVCDWPTCECALDPDKCKVQSVEPAPAQNDLLDGITWQADPYEANVYRMLRGNNWVAHIRMNGEMLIERHAAMLNAMLAAQSAQAAPAQDEREFAIELTKKVHRALGLSDSYLNVRDGGNGFERFKYDDTQRAYETIFNALATRPAQTEQQPAYGLYETRPAEAVAGIAKRQLGDERRWVEIRDLNAHAFPDMGPHDYYPVGTVLTMPAAPIAQTAPQPEQSGLVGQVCGGDSQHNTVNIAVVGPVPWGDLRIGMPVRLIPAPATPSPAEPVCSRCGGSGYVDDGEIDCYPNGEPYENGPVQCVKDCPACQVKSVSKLEQVTADTVRLEWMIAEGCLIESQNGTGSPTVYRVVWPRLGEAQTHWYPTEREAIDHAKGGDA